MNNAEIQKSRSHKILELVEYLPHTVVNKIIMNKSTGKISVTSFDSGEGLTQKISPFDTFVQIIDGNAEIQIDGKTHLLETGEMIIIPAHAPNSLKANDRFKMISTIIKSGYE